MFPQGPRVEPVSLVTVESKGKWLLSLRHLESQASDIVAGKQELVSVGGQPGLVCKWGVGSPHGEGVAHRLSLPSGVDERHLRDRWHPAAFQRWPSSPAPDWGAVSVNSLRLPSDCPTDPQKPTQC